MRRRSPSERGAPALGICEGNSMSGSKSGPFSVYGLGREGSTSASSAPRQPWRPQGDGGRQDRRGGGSGGRVGLAHALRVRPAKCRVKGPRTAFYSRGMFYFGERQFYSNSEIVARI